VNCVTEVCDREHRACVRLSHINQTHRLFAPGSGLEALSRRIESLLKFGSKVNVHMRSFKDSAHLFRLLAVFVVGFSAFLLLRGTLVPRSFGKYGHYRADAISEIAAKPIVYAGRQACESCHIEVFELKKTGKHARVACESCHGPLAAHAEDPGTVQPAKLDTSMLCPRCHTADIAKPKNFPQVVPGEHSNGMACNTCHKPHSPAMDSGETK
jgi:hypothetical protein